MQILANRIETIATGQQDLFIPSEKIEKLAQSYAARLIRNLSEPMEQASSTVAVPEVHKVHIDTFKQKEGRTVGAEHLLLHAAQELKLPQFLKKLDFSGTEIALSLATIISRAVFPASERATFSWLQQQSGLGELLDFDFCNISLQKLYDSSYLLLKHKEALEIYLEKEQRVIHGVTSTMILYDLTNMYMEGQAKGNNKARHGRSKEKRSDSSLITLGLVVDEHGFPFRSKILAGNVGEPTTLKKAIQELGCELDLFKPTIVLDTGIFSEENLEWLRKNGFYYIVSARQTPPSLEVEGDYMFAGSDEQVKVANIKIEGDGDKWLICHFTGEYFLRTNRQDKNAKELWDIYNTLRKIEDAFRFMKSSRGMRPIYHQK